MIHPRLSPESETLYESSQMECTLNESERFYGPSDLGEHLYRAFSATTFVGDMKHSVVCVCGSKTPN